MDSPPMSPVEVNWIFSAEVLEHKTPSREHGISAATERRYRREGARFIINASNTLKLRRDTLATGAVFFHRFFMVQSFKDFDRWVVASTCILLAGKVEETPKQCKSIIKVVQQLLTAEQMKAFGSNPKEELFSHERVLLQTIRFDLQVHHPYDYLLNFAKSLKGEKSKIEQVLQMAWTFINDSLCTTLCLQWEPPAIAVAMLYLAGKLSRFDLQAASQNTAKRSWWRQFVGTVDIHDLESICHQVLDVYSEEEKSQKQEDPGKTPTTSQQLAPDNTKGPPPPPAPLSVPVLSQSGHPSQFSSTTHMSYTAQTLQQAMVSQGSHANIQSTLLPQTAVNPQVVMTAGTQPSPVGLSTASYHSMLGHPHSNNSYQQPTTLNQYQVGMQIPQSGNIGGIPHLGQVGGASSRFTAGVSPQTVVAGMVARQQQQTSLFSNVTGMSGTAIPGPSSLHLPQAQSHPPPSHSHASQPQSHHHSYHSATGGGWR